MSSDRFVNSFPRSLGYNPNQLLAAAHIISAALPGLSIYDIYARSVDKLRSYVMCTKGKVDHKGAISHLAGSLDQIKYEILSENMRFKSTMVRL